MRRGRLAFLIASQTLFFWMFLSADPLEQLAAGHGPRSDAAMHFAAQWRHGMAANSPLYLPGFFLTAAAVWMHAARRPRRAIEHAAGVAAAAVVAFGAAAALSPWGAEAVVGAFYSQIGAPRPASIPRPSGYAAAIGGYTLLTWSAFVTCVRASLVRRSLYPFLLPAALTVGLALVRPWTADDFTRFWAMQVVNGDPVAWASLLAAIGLGTVLVRSEGTHDTKQAERDAASQPTAATAMRQQNAGGRDGARRSPERRTP
jgi:hypothetical protein